MKYYFILFLLIMLFSCATNNNSDILNTPSEKNWLITDSSVSLHTYTKRGLLDSTFETTYIFVVGFLSDSFRTITTRAYNAGNYLVHKSSFDINSKNKLTLYNETFNKYDQHDNLVSDKIYVRGELFSSSENILNGAGQRIKAILINPDYKNPPSSGINKTRTYDTSFLTYQYDDLGNMVKTVSTDRHGTTLEITTTVYDGKSIKSSITLNFAGDTIWKAQYLQENGFKKRILTNITATDTDTSWTLNNKTYKSISYNSKLGTRRMHVRKFNPKDDEITSVSYKQ